MSVIPIHGRGVNRGKLACDSCDARETVPCSYERRSGDWAPNEAQIRKKLAAAGWAIIKGKDLCPACVARRQRADSQTESDIVTKVTVPAPAVIAAGPTSKQVRLIILALEDVYDDAAGRYRGDNTDASVARELGADVMPGWVTEQREKLFGPAGNEEVEAIRAEIAAAAARFEEWRKEAVAGFEALAKRVDACVRAHDKRVGK